MKAALNAYTNVERGVIVEDRFIDVGMSH